MEEEAEKDEHVVLPALPAAHKSVIEKARKQVEGKPILAQYAGGKPWTAKSFKPVPSLASPPPPPPAGHLPTTTPAPPKHAKPPLRRQQLAPNSPSPVATITTHGVSGSLVAHVLEGSKGKKLRQQQQQQQPDSTGAAADEALKNVLLASITAQAQHCAGGGADGGEGGGEKAGPAGVTRRQVARLVLDANNLTESSMKMKQICGRATRLLADVERLHSGGAVLADVTERYRSITQRQDEASIWRDDSGSGSDTPGSDGGGRPPGARARKQHGGGDGKPDAESAAGGASDSEEEEFEAEPPELEYEDVTGMPAGRITHRAMDTISNIATDLTAIGDASASLQIELGISKKKPAFIKAGVRARDCRRLTMKVIWLQQKVARALDTARSYMIVATKTMNEQARAAHREIKV
ncbi:hypothetical protein DIPPA_25918 [Diplonema papillatum]|nr:hypothetical protein DIPPA_25918 [Diplonema papillatum]